MVTAKKGIGRYVIDFGKIAFEAAPHPRAVPFNRTRSSMPIDHISLVEGRSDEAIKACVKAVAHTVHETLGAPLDSIRVYATQVPAAHWAVGAQTKDERAAAGAPAPAPGER
jgi:4-oxalocrotonate tautomerase